MLTPKHIAFIMDGNGRWAIKRGLPRSAGHKAGYEHIPDVLKICQNLGIEVISGYAWSTENWGRPMALLIWLTIMVAVRRLSMQSNNSWQKIDQTTISR